MSASFVVEYSNGVDDFLPAETRLVGQPLQTATNSNKGIVSPPETNSLQSGVPLAVHSSKTIGEL